MIRCDLHMHSRNSYDCLMSPQAIIRAARRQRLDAIAVTDHESIRGGVETAAVAPEGLLVIVGMEIHTEVGDLVCLFLREEITSRDALTVIAETHRQGGIVFLPHPLQSHPRAIAEAVLQACDGYESLNSRAGHFDPRTAGDRSRWSLLEGKAALGNSDAHFTGEIGRAFTTMPGPATAENVKQRILSRETTAGGTKGTALDFYRSQLIKLAKTRDPRMLRGLARRIWRKLSG